VSEHNEHRIDYHRRHPNVLLSNYTAQKRKELGIKVSRTRKIYLDQRFWILLRDVSLGRLHDAILSNILTLIKLAVAEEKAICPISESVFIELLKQSDDITRLATAELIDELSKGVTLINFDQRVTQELRNAIYYQAGIPDLIPVDQLVWTKLAYILEEMHPTKLPYSPEESLVIQKAFYDHMWEIPLTKMVSLTGHTPENKDWDAVALKLNANNQIHSAELKSYAQTFKIEFEGGLSLFKNDLNRFLKESSERSYKVFGTEIKNSSQNKRFETFVLQIPTLHISATCHAAVRWDQKRNLKGNDLFDFQHAGAALSYCDIFLTEKPLSILLSQSHLGLSKKYQCKTFWSPAAALTWLQDNL
jgi:hypothetical protein